MRPLTERGMTLLELLLAMFLLATALLGLGASFPFAMYGVTTGGYQTQAALMGEQCLDIARSRSFSDLVAGGAAGLDAKCPAMFGGFSRNITLALNGTQLTITVVINFPEPTGINQTTLSTMRVQ